MMAAFMLAWTWNDITRIGHVVKKRLLEREYEMVRIHVHELVAHVWWG